jgi:twitching motility protein PilT
MRRNCLLELRTISFPLIRLEHTSSTERPTLADLDKILKTAVELKASDVHIMVDMPPVMRLFGEIEKLPGFDTLDEKTTAEMLTGILTEDQYSKFKVHKEVDFCYEIPELSRFRTNVYIEERGTGAAFRVIPSKIVSVEEIGISEAIKDLSRLKNGLVLVTGPAGCGKSTTLAALVNLVNRERDEHIITIEDPIEFVHHNIKSQVNQRQVGIHTSSFAAALRATLRADPDVILVGEMRDLETISMAITSAETGHLVFSTLHTLSAYKTIERVINVFPPSQQKQIRTMLSESLSGILSQQLIRNADGTGREAAMEILIATPSIRSMIRDEKTYQIPGYMQAGRKYGMCMLDDNIVELLRAGRVDPKHALQMATDKEFVRSILSKGQASAAL